MLNKERILERTNRGLDIFNHFIPVHFQPGKNFLNPFYDDRNASCNIYLDKKNHIYRMKDFGNDDYTCDPFDLVGKIYGLNCNVPSDFIKILDVINSELGLALDSVSGPLPEYPKKQKSFSYTPKEFSTKELEYWGLSGISLIELQHYHVISLKKYSGINREGKSFTLTSSEDEPMFGYLSEGTIKVYRPFSKLRFVYGGKKQDYCFGLEQLPLFGGLLFITGGEKDVITLFAHGYNAICFNSETSNIPEGIIKELARHFKYLIVLFDVDQAGKMAAQKAVTDLKKFRVQRLVLPLSGMKTEKDITDYFSLNRANRGFDLLIQNCLAMCSDYSNISVFVKINMIFTTDSENDGHIF